MKKRTITFRNLITILALAAMVSFGCKKTEMERARARERATDVESKCQHLSDGPKYKVDHSVATSSVPLCVSSVPWFQTKNG